MTVRLLLRSSSAGAASAVARSLSTTAHGARPVVHLSNSVNQAELTLVGIDHVSPASAELVRSVIRRVRPSTVAVELCEARGKNILSQRRNNKKHNLRDFFRLPGSFMQKLLTYAIENFYAGFGSDGHEPGEEFRVAVIEGHALRASVCFIDRNIQETLYRAGQHLYFKEVLKFFLSLRDFNRLYPNLARALSYKDSQECVEALLSSEEALSESIQMGEKYFPGLVKTLLYERNEFMFRHLRSMEGCIVGIVGALHVGGMHQLWTEAEREYSKREGLESRNWQIQTEFKSKMG